MEDLSINDTSEYMSYNTTDDYVEDSSYIDILNSVTWIIISISLPLTLVSLYFLVRDKHVLIYVINLLISGVIQLCCLIAIVVDPEEEMNIASFYIYWYAEIASIDFMVCVALERYLAIAHPLLYHFSRSIKVYVVVCVIIWLLPTVFIVADVFAAGPFSEALIFAIFHLLPFPFFIFFLVGAVKALSAAIHVTPVEKRRIVGTLSLPIITYSLLFTPFIIMLLVEKVGNDIMLTMITFILLFLSPLTNVIIYVFIGKGFMDKLLASLCCCKMDSDENNSRATSV